MASLHSTLRRVTACICLWVAISSSAHATPGIPPNLASTMRAHAEEVRRRSVPPPSAGYQDLQWQQLAARDWNPQTILDRLGVSQLKDDDPRAAAIMAEIRKEWDQARPNPERQGKQARLTGFPVMLDDGDGETRTVLLAPYYGACVHAPTPAANQMVLVTLDRPIPRSMYQFPIWVEGTLAVKASRNRYGRVAYAMEKARWAAYPYQKFPMPMYQLPRAH